MLNFKEFGLQAQLERALTAMNYQEPTPIQQKAIPAALTHRDLIGCAQTGTGKTAAFGIPMVSNLLKAPSKNALILAPTRELAAQIDQVLGQLTAFTPELKRAVLIGGAAMNPQIKALSRRPRIVIATPGRLVDHLRRGTLSLSATSILVLDEADRMLDMGFLPQINDVLRYLPKARQTMLFSATMPKEIERLTAKYLKDPVRVAVGEVSAPATAVAQSTIKTTAAKKNDVLVDELNARDGLVLIFARTKRRTDKLAKYLSGYGYRVNRIHGDRTQAQRNAAIEGFRLGRFDILVATDIAARGLDVSGITHVINYDLPQCGEDYVHRIGRTGRAGATGQALSLLTPEDGPQWKEITRLLKQSGAAMPAMAN